MYKQKSTSAARIRFKVNLGRRRLFYGSQHGCLYNQAQEDFKRRKAELDGMEAQLQALVEEIQRGNEEVRRSVVNYVKEYNKKSQYNYVLTYTDGPGGVVILANDSLDITNEILEGLNAQYKAKKANKK